jgi:Flp pilus assembly secretin CpaC
MVRVIFVGALVSSFVLAVVFSASGHDAQRRIEHLSRAAAHLQQAGFADKAAEIRELIAAEAAGEVTALLTRKLDALAALQAEIDQLRASLGEAGKDTDQATQIRIAVRLLSFQPDKLEDSGFPLVSLRQLLDQPEATPIIDESGKLSEFIDLLLEQKLVKCIAEPTLVTIPGQEASYFSGRKLQGATPANEETPHLEIGTRLRCLATVENSEIILDLDFRDSKLAAVEPVAAPAGAGDAAAEGGGERTGDFAAPMPLETLALKTRIRLQSGQTAIVGGLRVKQQRAQEPPTDSVVIFVVTAEVVEPRG